MLILPGVQLVESDLCAKDSFQPGVPKDRVQDSVSFTRVLPTETRVGDGTKGLDSVLQQLEETVETSGEGLPLLCWHCSQEFTSFEQLR